MKWQLAWPLGGALLACSGGDNSKVGEAPSAAPVSAPKSEAELAEPAEPAPVIAAPPQRAPELVALEAALEHGIRPSDPFDGSYRVDAFIVALVVESLRGSEPTLELKHVDQPPAGPGYRIANISPGSLFARLGVRDGDVVQALNGVALTGFDVLGAALARETNRVRITVFREQISFELSYHVLGLLAWAEILRDLGAAVTPYSGTLPEESADTEGWESGDGGSPAPRLRVPTPTPGSKPDASAPKAQPVHCSSSSQCTIARPFFNRMVASPAKLESQAQIVPAIRNDVHSGYKLKKIKKGSAIDRLGFRSGDKITHINGRFLGSDAEALALYLSLQNTRTFKIRFERGGRRMNKTVRVR